MYIYNIYIYICSIYQPFSENPLQIPPAFPLGGTFSSGALMRASSDSALYEGHGSMEIHGKTMGFTVDFPWIFQCFTYGSHEC